MTMTNASIASELGIPEGFSVVLFTFCFVLALAPWLAGKDFGFFIIPHFSGSTRRALKFIGPAAFAIVFTVHLPLLSQSASRPDDPAQLPQQTTPRDHGRQEADSLISELQQPNRQPVPTPLNRGLPRPGSSTDCVHPPGFYRLAFSWVIPFSGQRTFSAPGSLTGSANKNP